MFGQFEAIFPAPVREFLHHRMMVTKTADMIGIAETMTAEPDRVEELAATGIRVLVVAGEGDFIPVDVQQDAATRLGVTLEIIRGAFHSPNEEKPEELTEVLVGFWNQRGV
jgi:pimeloyl-ACP methyl ester carboxylesterase